MLGGLQFRALHAERVGSGELSERAFHDQILRHNSIPVAALRASTADELPPKRLPPWRF